MNHLLSISDLPQEHFLELIDRSSALARSNACSTRLAGRSVGIWFRKTSTRTRTSFAAAAVRLGAYPVVFGCDDLQTNTGESLEDTAAVLGGYLEALVVRTAGNPEELRRMADVNRLPIVNAMTADEHPTQALSDLAMLQRHFGRLQGLRLIYIGEGNNTAAALALAGSRVPGLRIDFHCPPQYAIPAATWSRARESSARFGGRISLSTEAYRDDAEPVHAVYATRWQTTGTAKSDHAWRESFAPYRATAALMDSLRRDAPTVFMHDLPAVRGEDCDAAVLDGPHSIAFEQARQKLFTAMAIFDWCVAA